MHYLFFDESYSRKSPGKVAFSGWIVEQDRLNRRPERVQEQSRMPVLRSIDAMLEEFGAWAIVAEASLDPTTFRSGEIDGTCDVARMSRTDNIWATCATFLVGTLISGFYQRQQYLATVDIYHDPKSLKSDHNEARCKALRGFLVRHAKQFAAAHNKEFFKKLNIRRIESVAKQSHSRSTDKFQNGIWVADKLCSKADAVESGRFSRIRSYDISEEVRRTIQQYDGKRFEDD